MSFITLCFVAGSGLVLVANEAWPVYIPTQAPSWPQIRHFNGRSKLICLLDDAK
jgi:hypothetical protein